MLLDAHIHLQDIQDAKLRETVLAQAGGRGISKFFCNAARAEDWPILERLASSDSQVVPFFGIHPWFAQEVKDGWQTELENYLKRPDCGVGEIGLDRRRLSMNLPDQVLDRRRLTLDRPDQVPVRDAQARGGKKLSAEERAKEKVLFDKQKEIFSGQLEIAKRLNKPVVIHCVQAWGELLAMLRSYFPQGGCFMIHSFSGSGEVLRELLSMGAFISFSWKGLRGEDKEKMDLVRSVPPERLLLETDFPYTEPHPPTRGIASVARDGMRRTDPRSPADGGADGDERRIDLSAEKYFSCLTETYKIAAETREIQAEILQKKVWANGETFLHGTHPRSVEA